MSGGAVQDTGGAAELEKLATELDGQVYAVTLVTAAGRRPCLSITNRQATQLTEHIYAAPADDGAWSTGGLGAKNRACRRPRRRGRRG